MSGVMIILGLLVASAPSEPPPAGWVSHTFSRAPSLEVLVRAADGQQLPGATVTLCPMEHTEKKDRSDLAPAEFRPFIKIADAEGTVRFDRLQRTTYRVVVQLDGFASTAVYPLLVGERERGAPDQILVVLNGWCCEY